MIAASRPMIASTHSISISAKPDLEHGIGPANGRTRWRGHRSARAACNISCRSTAAFLPVGAERDDFVGRAFAGRAIDIAVAPWIVRHHAAAQVWAVPALRVGGTRQGSKAL